MEPVRFGVVGVGGMGAAHVNALMEMEEAELVAGADIVPETRDNFKAKHGRECYATYQELLARKDIEAVCVVTPHPLHMPVAVEALRQGKHVLSEKPIAGTVCDADEMINAAKETGLKLGVVFQQRTRPDLLKVAAMIHSGELGTMIRASMTGPAFRTQAYYDRGAAWRGKWKTEQGGVLLNQAPHPLDMFVWLAGMPVRVTGMVATRMHRMETEDMATAILEYANGAHGTLHTSTCEAPSGNEMEIAFTRGKVVIRDDVRICVPNHPLDDYIANATDTFGKMEVKWKTIEADSKASHAATIRDFALAVREDRAPMVPGEEGRKSLELANAIVLSHYRGKTLELPMDRADYAALLREKCS